MSGDNLRRDTVLVVDDEPDSLRFLTDALEGAGITVLVAISGAAALDLLEHVVPDLILMDAVMPGIDGFAATRQIKARSQLAHVPVMFMTGLTESEHVIEGFEAGGVDYLRKPVNVHELLARVRVHLGNARAMQASAAGLEWSPSRFRAPVGVAFPLAAPLSPTHVAWDGEDAARRWLAFR